MQFFFFLLANGYDFRNTGLAWIVNKLMVLKQKVYDTHLPSFLDQKAKEFVLSKGSYLKELDELMQEQNNFFSKYQSSMKPSKGRNSSMYSSQTDLHDTSLPSLFVNDQSKFSSIDVTQAREKVSHRKKNQVSSQDISSLTYGMKEMSVQAVENMVQSINHKVVLTKNDLIYSEVTAE